MSYPNLNEEKKLWRKRYKRVAGLDESGRGPLCGPVVAGAVIIKSTILIILKGVKDSKKLSLKKREKLYKLITRNQNIEWGIGIVSEKKIDKINIKNAAELAMEKAIASLRGKPDFLIFDKGVNLQLGISKKSILNADEKVFSCAAASILAKVTRDRIMMRYDKKYPQYGFAKHKGYPTKYHIRMLKRFGSCKIHRKTFGPVKRLDS